ncbi:Amidohydrolase-related domain-containing protein [Vibrio neptunius]
MFMFVIGLSTEEPAFKRTTTWKALVAAKAWVSHYPKLVVEMEILSIQTLQDGFATRGIFTMR